MMASAAPINIPSECARRNQMNDADGYFFTRKQGVLLIALLEIFGSLTVMTVYIYGLAVHPSWYPTLVPIPDDLCNATNVVHGVMYIIVLLCVLELFMAFYLLDSARKEKLERVHFWLSSMLTYLALVTVVILGMDLGGIHCPTMNSAAFINIFLRFLEILMVYAWAEQESMRRKLRGSRISRNCSTGLSSLTICTMASADEGQNRGTTTDSALGGDQTPPPSYSSTIPSRSLVNIPPPPPRADSPMP